jgi:GTP pyrophosphokinase
MTELEKIAYAKSFIDKLANGINPLDDTPIPDDDIVNNVRLSRCFFYVSSILQKEIDRERRKQPKEKKPIEKIDSKKIIKLTPEAIQKNFIIADCCKPIPGDDVLGYIDEKNRVIIHKRQCPLANKLKTSYGNRLLAVQWETGKSLEFPVNIYIKGIDTIGLLNKVTQIISEQLNVNIRKVYIDANDGIFEGHIQMFVHDVDDVKTIITKLQKIEEMKTVTRIEQFEDTP